MRRAVLEVCSSSSYNMRINLENPTHNHTNIKDTHSEMPRMPAHSVDVIVIVDQLKESDSKSDSKSFNLKDTLR